MDERYNPDLDAAFNDEPHRPAANTPGDIRHNPDLDDAFGIEKAMGKLEAAAAKLQAVGGSSAVRDLSVGEVGKALATPSGPPGEKWQAELDAQRKQLRDAVLGEDDVGPLRNPADDLPRAKPLAPVFGANPEGGHGAETVRVLIDIRGLLLEHFVGGARERVFGPEPGRDQGQAGGGIWDAIRPVTDRLGNTRLGRLARQVWHTAAPVRQHLGGPIKRAVGDRVQKWLGGGRPAKARPVGKPQPVGPAARPIPGGVGTQAGMFGGRFAAAGVGGAGSAAEASAGAGSAAGGGGAGAAAGGSAGLAAAAAAAVVVAGAALAFAAVTEAGYDLAKEQERHARLMAEWSPSLAAAMAQLDANRAVRDLDTGERTDGSTQELTRGMDRLERAWQPFEVILTDLKNTIGGATLNMLADILAAITTLTEAMKALPGVTDALKELEKRRQQEESEGLDTFLGRVAAENEARRREVAERMAMTRAAHDRHRG